MGFTVNKNGLEWQQTIPESQTSSPMRNCCRPAASFTLRVQVPNYHILSRIVTYITTILDPNTQLLDPLDRWGYVQLQAEQPQAVAVQEARAIVTKQQKPSLLTASACKYLWGCDYEDASEKDTVALII